MALCWVALISARVERKNPHDKPTIKIYKIKDEDKQRVPLAFSFKKKLERKERKSAQKKLTSLTVKPIKEMTEKELRSCADLALGLESYEDALRYLERLKIVTKSSTTVKELKLEIADLHFEQGALKVSAQEYEEFLKLYPGDKQAEYAQYKGLLSNFYAMLEADRDQTATHNTIKLADSFLDKSDRYKQYNKDVESIKYSCYERLYDHEVVVFDYYMSKGSFKAAETRLTSITKNYSKKLPDTEPKTLHLAYRLADAQGKTKEAQKIQYRLASKFPNQSLRLAQNGAIKQKKSYVNFF